MEPYAPHPYKLLQGRKKQQILTEDGYAFTKKGNTRIRYTTSVYGHLMVVSPG